MTRTEIRDNLRLVSLIESTNVTSAELDTLINQALLEIGLEAKWPFLQASSTVSLVANQKEYAVPNDFEYGEKLVDDDNDNDVEYISPGQYFDLYGNDTGNTGSTPRAFTIWEDEIIVTPIPDTNDTDRLTLYYYKTITTLSSDGAEPEFNKAFHWMVIEWVKWKLWEREEYFDQADRARANYKMYVNDMIQWYMTQFKSFPYIFGDGRRQKLTDPNLPFLDGA